MSRMGQNPLADPDFAKQVAESFANGLNRRQMCNMFGVSDPATITRWRRDPRVLMHAKPIIEDRILQITRKVDAEIASRLAAASEMSVRELLEIRKEFLGGMLRTKTENIDDDTVVEAMKAIEENPAFADSVAKLFSGDTEESEAPVAAEK